MTPDLLGYFNLASLQPIAWLGFYVSFLAVISPFISPLLIALSIGAVMAMAGPRAWR